MRIHQVLLSFFITLYFINLSVISECLSHQQILLLHLKDNLIFNTATSKKLVYWNQSGDCCQWNGVKCNKGQVISLDLSEENISGGLSSNSSLLNLQYLQNLNLAYNDFGSHIPSSFQKLKNLRHLNLSNAGFKGQIPAEISQLTKLSTLDLSSSFTSQTTLILEKPDIGVFLQNLTQITKLYLDGVKVSAGGKQWSQALSSSLKNLQVLSMSSCNLSGPIDNSLSKLQSLSEIRLNLNNMSSSVPKSFANFTNLTVLQLISCGLTGVFPKEIFQVQTLEVLDISDNQELHGSLPKFRQGGYLHTLNLSYTNLSGELPGSISNLKRLSSLDLSNCQFNGTLPTSLSRLTHLVHLDLSFNYFNGSLPSFNLTKNLEYLSLYNNDLSGVVSSTHWEGLVKLLSINLGDNFFTGRVPSSLFTLPSLQQLTLSQNNFFGLLEHFPNASSSALQLIDLSKNKLQGPIPLSLFELTRLEFLQLSSNQFNGTMQLDLLRRLQHLRTFGLSDNNVNVDATFNDEDGLPSFPSLLNILLGSCNLREFPRFLKNQSRLMFLDLSNNHIQGLIPNWIWRFDSMFQLNLSNNFLTDLEGPFDNLSSNLFSVDLHSNQLQGMAPMFMEYIVYIDYSNNKFSLLPPYIGKHIYFLSLANNSFHGKIHESFCNPSNLYVLDLSHNNFIGSIDDCLKNMSNNLKVLSLTGNKLTGHVSDTFSGSCNLRFLDLNGNLLAGVIPKSLANCQSLELLNLGNNLFSDRFPCFLKDIPSLRVLILRSNKLHGPIGCTYSTGNWSVLHIVDLASNNFNGTIPGTLLKSWTAMAGYIDDVDKKSNNLYVDSNFRHLTHFKDLLLVLDKFILAKVAKMVAPEPYSEADSIFNYGVQTDRLVGDSYMEYVTIVSKGSQMMLVKILSVFTYLDLSSNQFEGPIPQEVMSLRAMNVLNLSHNSLSSHISPSLGDLTQLESLDMSYNTLSGEIPAEITSLSFLSVLNLSFNHLVGKIPIGTQIQSFESYSFEGNEGLCGAPLTKNCGAQGSLSLPSPTASTAHSSIDWNFLSAELGFTFGFGFFIFPIILWKRWRLWYNKHVDDLLYMMIPQLDFVYEQSGQYMYRTLRWRTT
ncbi:hypothetical protein RIF29_08496 [Crotalaria pallida]|uniref:Leucine-rich repeat-containing N-terminal plant-type domain-containing protein n=1 Tax=Crotalaria pallida TaxID=3830 RepID=A0AAN9FTJ5_CROPI